MRADRENNSLMTECFFSEAEQEIIIGRVFELLKKQVNKYNGIDSTSLPVEKAQDILESLLYTINVALENSGTREELSGGDLSHLVDIGQSMLKEKKESVKVEWKLMYQELPQVRNVYYTSTIEEIGMFFKRYEIYYEAHHIPCSIDYWLLCPVSEKLKGISYIEAYIRYLQIENDFVNCFKSDDLRCLYKKYVPDYTETLFNLCEPVLTNAIGLSMLGQDVHSLNISGLQREELARILRGKSKDEIQSMIAKSIILISQQTGMTEKNETDYLISGASGLAVRLYEALKVQDLSHLFITFGVEEI